MTTPSSSARCPRPTWRRLTELHDECIRLDPALKDAPVHPEARRGMCARFCAILQAFQDLLPAAAPGALEGLEVGVGEGALWLALQEFVPSVRWHGLDIPRRHAAYQAAFDELLARRGLSLTEADLSREPIPRADASTDAVSFSEVLEHLPPDSVLPLLGEIARVLRPGGLLVATSPNLTSLLNRLLLLAGVSPFHLPVAEDEFGCRTYPHIHLYTVSEFEELCRCAGLVPARRAHRTYLAGAFFAPGRLLRNAALRLYLAAEHLLGTLAPGLRDGWLVAARKP